MIRFVWSILPAVDWNGGIAGATAGLVLAVAVASPPTIVRIRLDEQPVQRDGFLPTAAIDS